MINWLHSVLHDPRRGWDPITEQYARDYAKNIASLDAPLVAHFTQLTGSLADKDVADVGSGPGQYALEFASRGARVTCFDISRRYLQIAAERFSGAALEARFVVGYMDHIDRLGGEKFDAIFNNACWYYCMNDLAFARAMLQALKPGGVILVRVQTSPSPGTPWYRRVMYWLNRTLFWKVGHVLPPPGRVAHAFRRLGGCEVETAHSNSTDVVSVRKQAQSAIASR